MRSSQAGGLYNANFLRSIWQRVPRNASEMDPENPRHVNELFARGTRKGWSSWGTQADEHAPTWKTYANHSGSSGKKAATLFD